MGRFSTKEHNCFTLSMVKEQVPPCISCFFNSYSLITTINSFVFIYINQLGSIPQLTWGIRL